MRSIQIKIFPVEGQEIPVNNSVNGREATPEGKQ